MNELLCIYSAAINAKCSRVCGEYGCWGPSEDQCVRCPNYRHNETRVCLESCNQEPRLYADDSTPQKQCRPCDPQCLNSCTGPVITILCGRYVTLDLFHDLLSCSYLQHCVKSVITGHNSLQTACLQRVTHQCTAVSYTHLTLPTILRV